MAKLKLTVALVGQDGNIFNLMALVTRAMKRNGMGEHVEPFLADIRSSHSYDEALQKIMAWVEVD